MTSLDLNALSATDTEAPAATKRSNKVAASPFPTWIQETYESGKAKAITVPASQVGELRYAVRAAAKLRGLGSRIVLRDKDNKPLDWFSGDGKAFVVRGDAKVPDNTNVTVVFRGQEKRARRTAEEIESAESDEDQYEDDYEDETETE